MPAGVGNGMASLLAMFTTLFLIFCKETCSYASIINTHTCMTVSFISTRLENTNRSRNDPLQAFLAVEFSMIRLLYPFSMACE